MICQKTSSSSFSSSSSSFFYSSIPKRNIRRFIGLKMTASKNWFAYSAKTRYAKICSIGAGIKSLQESLKSHFKLTALFKLKLIFRLARTIQLICDIPNEFKIKQTSFLTFFVKEKGKNILHQPYIFFLISNSPLALEKITFSTTFHQKRRTLIKNRPFLKIHNRLKRQEDHSPFCFMTFMLFTQALVSPPSHWPLPNQQKNALKKSVPSVHVWAVTGIDTPIHLLERIRQILYPGTKYTMSKVSRSLSATLLCY